MPDAPLKWLGQNVPKKSFMGHSDNGTDTVKRNRMRHRQSPFLVLARGLCIFLDLANSDVVNALLLLRATPGCHVITTRTSYLGCTHITRSNANEHQIRYI